MKQMLIVSLLVLVMMLGGCTKQPDSPEQIRERSAQATETLKKNAADATAVIKRDTTAIAEGVREGWNRDHPLNVNAATKEQLTTLPGVTAETADRIIAGRPYGSAGELVSKKALTQRQYDALQDKVTAK